MTVPSLHFLAFAALSALVFNLGRAAWWRQGVKLAVNLAFLASFAPHGRSLVPFAGFIALGFAGQAIEGRGRKRPLFAGLVLGILGVFVWLKRYGFVPPGLLLPLPYVTVGLSYVFFRVLHVVIDRHEGAIERPVGPLSYLNYTLDFTCLVAGPIQRYQEYRAMQAAPPRLDLPAAGVALERIAAGYFKVAVVSMLLALVRRQAMAAMAVDQAAARVGDAMLIVGLYPIYLYFNFSGYTDVVIGAARFFRIQVPENFDHPFSAANFIEFWSRWHITLSAWLRSYVFNPLLMAGMRRAPRRAAPWIGVGAFFVTFFLVGVWHGQSSEFLFFGVLQGGGVAANKLYQLRMQAWLGHTAWQALGDHPIYRAAMRGLTFTWFTFTLLWFWADWARIGALGRSVGPAGGALAWLCILVLAALVLASLQAARRAAAGISWNGTSLLASRYVRTSVSTALVVLTVIIILLLELPAPDIVYRSF